MKLLLILSLVGLAGISTIPLKKKENTYVTKPSKTISEQTRLLTLQYWIYEEYVKNYSSSSARQVFKKEKETNEFDLSKNLIKFNADGSFEEWNENGEHFQGTWNFLNDAWLIPLFRSSLSITAQLR